MEGTIDRQGRLMTEETARYIYYRKTFLYTLGIATLLMIPFVIFEWIRTGYPVFLYYGDYNAQQIAFYRHCVDMVHSGNFGWDWYTDMGSNFVGSYSYYLLGSPFFWLMCLFPSSWAPYLMAPMYIVKYIVASMLAYCYLKRWVRNQDYAVLGALLYSFCGFQIYNTFFNQFHDVVAVFPLLLIGMEELIQNRRKGVFAVAVCLNAMGNYFMFAGQVFFCVIYFLFRCMDRSFRITGKKFLALFAEAVMGFMMSMVLFWPAALGVLGNSRLNRFFSSMERMLFWFKDDGLYWQRYGQIVSSYFFPPDIPSRTNMFCGHTERWSSVSGWIPLFGMTGVFSLFTLKKRKWLKALIVFLILCSVVPVLNSLFFLGNTSYYARWMYMMIMMFCVGTVIALDHPESRWKGALTVSLCCIGAFAIPFGLLWFDNPYTEDTVDYQLGRPPYILRFWLYTAIAVAGIAILWYLVRRLRGTPAFSRGLLAATSVVILVYGCLHIGNGKMYAFQSSFMVNQAINGKVELPSAEEEFYRIDFYRTDSISTLDNLNIYWHYPSIECFHTVVPPSLMDFYSLVGYNRSVGSRTNSSWYGLRGLTSTRYSFIRKGTNGRKEVSVEASDESANLNYEEDSSYTFTRSEDGMNYYMKEKFETEKGWDYYGTQNEFDIYENENYLTMGFWFDEFMTETEFKKVSSGYQRSCLLCTYLVVPDDEADYYARFMKEVTDADRKKANYGTFTDSVADRKAESALEFTWDSYGFRARVETESPEIVFFSVPYDGGWSAQVNGQPAEVRVVDGGMIAVEVPAGASTVEFSYRTNGIMTGLLVTGAGLVLFLLYLLIFKFRKKEKADYKFFRGSYYEESDYNIPTRREREKLRREKAAAEAEADTETDDEYETLPDDEETEPESEERDANDANDANEANDAFDANDENEGKEKEIDHRQPPTNEFAGMKAGLKARKSSRG
ncbi:MAG: YfhO family protein [Clostridia bacterium]|nr:YfhO family protein [Clostridia bacterium]